VGLNGVIYFCVRDLGEQHISTDQQARDYFQSESDPVTSFLHSPTTFAAVIRVPWRAWYAGISYRAVLHYLVIRSGSTDRFVLVVISSQRVLRTDIIWVILVKVSRVLILCQLLVSSMFRCVLSDRQKQLSIYFYVMTRPQYCVLKIHDSKRKDKYRVARENVPNFRMALCNRAGEINQQKSMCVMSKHLRICLRIFT